MKDRRITLKKILQDELFCSTYSCTELKAYPPLQAFYMFTNNIKSVPLCVCDTPLEFVNNAVGFKNFCSNKCRAKQPRITENHLDTELRRMLEEWEGKSIDFLDIIVPKKFFIKYIEKYGKEKMAEKIPLIFEFLRRNVKQFPNYKSREKISRIFEADLSEINVIGNTFNNSISSKGNTYLKQLFKSFTLAKNNGGMNVHEAYLDDTKLKSIIKFRIGVNNLNEVYDLSLKEIYKGHSAVRGVVSFFKPAVAYLIYRNFLGSKKKPKTFDPCCGFGGRMLGFFKAYPHGTYIGCEPNSQTYEELLQLKSEIHAYLGHEIDVRIYKMKAEDYISIHGLPNVDLSFTSIPYFDLEVYSEDVVGNNYSSFDDWRNKFIMPLTTLPNCYLNMSRDVFERIGLTAVETFYLSNHVAKHMNKNEDRKSEVIIKFDPCLFKDKYTSNETNQ